jgi:dimethylglycine catabolism A
MLLFEPVRINSLHLPNRIVLPAMVTRLAGEDGLVNSAIMDRYIRFSEGLPGLIVIEAMAVHDYRSGPLLRISNDSFIAGLKKLCIEMKSRSPSQVVPQIIHFLKISRSGWRQKIEDLSVEEIRSIVTQYGLAAARARECGFDGVELHMAHAYTLSSFLSRLNSRRDDYGGNLENRMRLMSEVVLEVRKRVGSDFSIGVRYCAEECVKGGYTVEESRFVAERIARLGADYISLSAGGKFEDAIVKPGLPIYPYTGYSGDRCMPGKEYPDAANHYMSREIKQHLNSTGLTIPVIATGKIRTAEQAENILRNKDADLIGMARALLADPDLPKKSLMGLESTVVRCIYGNVCKSLDENFRQVVCALWPKGALHAPRSNDKIGPVWPPEGAALGAKGTAGRVALRWHEAKDNERVYGYDVYRSRENKDLEWLTSVKKSSFVDRTVLSGVTYNYLVKAYDMAGNRSESSNRVTVLIP